MNGNGIDGQAGTPTADSTGAIQSSRKDERPAVGQPHLPTPVAAPAPQAESAKERKRRLKREAQAAAPAAAPRPVQAPPAPAPKPLPPPAPAPAPLAPPAAAPRATPPQAAAPADAKPAVAAPRPPAPPEAKSRPVQPPPRQRSTEKPAPQPALERTPGIKPMHVVMLSPEISPAAKVGGIADVIFGLSGEIARRGHNVEVILPKYDCLRLDRVWDLKVCYQDLWVPWYGGHVHATVHSGLVYGRKCLFIEAHGGDQWFNRGCIYGQRDDIMRFAFFCRAAMEFLLKSGRRPDILHVHDWQTALAPVLLYEIYQNAGLGNSRVCLTVHNFKHQGLVGDGVIHALGLGRADRFFQGDKLRDNRNHRALNLLKGGIVYSNFVTTVSPHHAWEAKDGGQGFGLEPTLHAHHLKYGGVLNGIDYEAWNPATDVHIPHHYSADDLAGKYRNKAALRARLMLADGAKPIIAFVGRLDPQKGIDMVRHAIMYAVQHNAQFVLLGTSPDQAINNAFWGLKKHLNESPDCHLELAFDEDLAHLVYAGSDLMIVPSIFEPCGLTQLIALRYGSVPVVRSTGGLADTVFDKDHSERPIHERNGYVFKDPDTNAVSWALERAISCYYAYPQDFRDLIVHGMRRDFSWKESGLHYEQIYDLIRVK